MVKALECLASKEFVRERELLAVLPMSSSTLRRQVKAGHFPAPRYLTPGIKYWLVREIMAWAAEQDRSAKP